MRLDQVGLQRVLDEALVRNCVPGASVAVYHDGRLVRAAAGVINVSTGVALTPETVMHIGSITKVFNATLVMQLVDQGVVDLDERVVRYLPDLRLGDPQALDRLTVRMLLNHTSGIDGEGLPDHGHDEETLEKGVARIGSLGQLFAPGTEFSYCNAGTVIAGFLVQRLTGSSWYRVLRERILEPMQMEYAATLPEEALLYRASVGHYYDPISKTLRRTSFAFLPMGFAPAGVSLMMSAADLVAFARVHTASGMAPSGRRILSAAGVAAMQARSVNNVGKGYTFTDHMGLGWMLYDDGLMHHSGGGPGVVGMVYAHPKHDWAVAVLTNAEHGWRLIFEIVQPLLEEISAVKPYGFVPVPLPDPPLAVNPDKYVGVYEDVANRHHISRMGAGIGLAATPKFSWYETIRSEEAAPVRLIPVGNERFLLEGTGSREGLPDAFRVFTFRNPDSQGRMQYLGSGMRLRPRVS